MNHHPQQGAALSDEQGGADVRGILAEYEVFKENYRNDSLVRAMVAALTTQPQAEPADVRDQRIETLLRGINEARQLMDPIWRERMGAESVREHVQRGLRCLDSAIADCRFFDAATPTAQPQAEPRTEFEAAIREAFNEGFCAPETYNDTLLNTADEAWEKSHARTMAAAQTERERFEAAAYRWLRDNSGVDLRTPLGIGDFTSFDAHIAASMGWPTVPEKGG